MLSILALVAAAAAPAPLQQAPLEREEDIWALTQRLGTGPAYQAYLNRFPEGVHSDAAVAALSRLQGLRRVQAAPAPPAPPPVSGFAADPCVALTHQALTTVESQEARTFLAAKRSNRISDYQAFLAQFPTSACRSAAERAVRSREVRRMRFVRIPGFGPLGARRMTPMIISVDDYPAAALRNEETGRVVARWQVAEDGVPESCEIVESSGSRALDETTCRLVTARLRYDPARDASGTPVRTTDQISVGWILPPDDRPPLEIDQPPY